MKLLERIRRRNRERLERRHAVARALESIAANQSALVESLGLVLRDARDERRQRASSEAALSARLQALEKSLATALEQLAARTADLEELLVQQTSPGARLPVKEPTGRTELLNPEADLLAHLADALPHRTALDIGANVGDVAAALLDAGLTVHAFEPAPATLEALRTRLGARPGFVAHGIAVGRTDGSAQLHLARDTSGGKYGDPSLYASLVDHAMLPDLQFAGAVQVEVRSLESLHRSGDVPAQVGLVKIDTEGLDLEVIRGMGDRTYPLVVAEFWDPECEFGRAGAQNRLDELVSEMRRRGYRWHLVLYRVWGRGDVAWYANRSASVERSWGNVLFFRERRLFAMARRWCAAELPQARFVPAPAGAEAAAPQAS
jgi:FkbM family methyltransferase